MTAHPTEGLGPTERGVRVGFLRDEFAADSTLLVIELEAGARDAADRVRVIQRSGRGLIGCASDCEDYVAESEGLGTGFCRVRFAIFGGAQKPEPRNDAEVNDVAFPGSQDWVVDVEGGSRRRWEDRI